MTNGNFPDGGDGGINKGEQKSGSIVDQIHSLRKAMGDFMSNGDGSPSVDTRVSLLSAIDDLINALGEGDSVLEYVDEETREQIAALDGYLKQAQVNNSYYVTHESIDGMYGRGGVDPDTFKHAFTSYTLSTAIVLGGTIFRERMVTTIEEVARHRNSSIRGDVADLCNYLQAQEGAKNESVDVADKPVAYIGYLDELGAVLRKARNVMPYGDHANDKPYFFPDVSD